MCGGSVFKAATIDAKTTNKYDVTGLIVSACRHGLIRGAINMHHGETFTHTHFMPYMCYRLNCQSFCYDVICRYWDFAKRVSRVFPEFRAMMSSMNGFLPMMHAKAHHLPCQVFNIIIFIYICIKKQVLIFSGSLEPSLDKRKWDDDWRGARTSFFKIITVWIRYQALWVKAVSLVETNRDSSTYQLTK